MKHLFLWVIKCYWFIIPASKRSHCIFKTSCSHYVFNITKTEGLARGIEALRYRYRHCRPGYLILDAESRKILVSSNNVVFQEEEIDSRILNSFESHQNETK